MFDKLKRAFSNAAKSISQRELSEKDLDESLFDLNVALLESDVSQEVIDDLSQQIKDNLVGMKLQKNETTEQIIASMLKDNFSKILAKAGTVDLISAIKTKKQNKGGPFKIVFLGINGTGKTTTVAKVANLLKKSGFSIVIAAADTHRAGAIEQISSHAEKLSIKVISQRYGADPSAVSRDALEYARKHYIDVVLIDTAGRMQTAKNLMDEIGKIVKVIKPDIKLFVGDSLSGNDTINQAREFFSYTEFDGAILTKTDADAKGGSAISISYITSKPIIYLGVGQGYDDIIKFNRERFVETIFNNESLLDSHRGTQTSLPQEDYVVSDIEDANVGKDTVSLLKDDVLEGRSRVFDPNFVTEDGHDSEVLLTENSTEVLPGLAKELVNDESKIDSSSSFNNPVEPSESSSIDKLTTGIEKISNAKQKVEEEERKDQGEKKSRFGWFKKKK
ncbi:signal recognition particle-docking protein FtsY [Candidatus Nitrosocosmicus arcticus]|uniref:Signal recognition particle receptor FtsY n=1 Tax=Candidatus Nitrosocosmicus arcticus TaxID=2035267 RepID=A0A557SSH8_9ARCH|nr:signal recognition particle-docking protein FtsY [Candidatus Nitrosocosmicus arcticus]TVP39542.1 Signal recognition particle receptor FtsY [Candidatus Nitrosocosmicus arcticus]